MWNFTTCNSKHYYSWLSGCVTAGGRINGDCPYEDVICAIKSDILLIKLFVTNPPLSRNSSAKFISCQLYSSLFCGLSCKSAPNATDKWNIFSGSKLSVLVTITLTLLFSLTFALMLSVQFKEISFWNDVTSNLS